MSDSNDNSLVNPAHIVTSEFLVGEMGDDKVSSTMLNKAFIPFDRVPLQMAEKIASSPDDAQRMLQAESAIYSFTVDKPYWKGDNAKVRGFDKLYIDVYGALLLAPDANILDNIIAHGNMITNASKYTLRQILSSEKIGIKSPRLDLIANRSALDKPLLNRGVYFHLPINTLLKALQMSVGKKNRDKILTSMRRLSLAQLSVSPELEDERRPGVNFSLVDVEHFLICDESKIRNKSSITHDTFTDLIVNISDFYVDSLRKDGQIDRKRLRASYPDLVGNENLEDFLKYVDSHKREFIHNKFIKQLIINYLDDKATLLNMNKAAKVSRIYKAVVAKRNEIFNHFSFRLYAENGDDNNMKFIYEKSI